MRNVKKSVFYKGNERIKVYEEEDDVNEEFDSDLLSVFSFINNSRKNSRSSFFKVRVCIS